MFEIGWTEMLVIAIVMIVVVGPKDLPKMLRTFGIMTSRLRGMAGDFRKQFDEALKEAELDDVKNLVDDAKKLNPAGELRKALNPMQKAADDVRAGLKAAMDPNASPDSGKAKSSTLGDGKPFDMSKVNAAARTNMASSMPRPKAEESPASIAPEAAPAAVVGKAASAKKPGVRKSGAGKGPAATKPAPATKAAAKPVVTNKAAPRTKRAPSASAPSASAKSVAGEAPAAPVKDMAGRRAAKAGGTRT